MRLTAIIVLSFTLLFAKSPEIRAADIKYLGLKGPDYARVATFRISGDINRGVISKFIETLDKISIDPQEVWDTAVELNSPGGSFLEGMGLAVEFRRRGVSTIVRGGDECFSACALAFLGGSERLPNPFNIPAEIPNQLPSREVEEGGVLGFHAPYLAVRGGEYTAQNVEEAYRSAVDSIALLINLADHLYVEPTELPRLLEPDRESMYLVNTVDSIRMLWIRYLHPRRGEGYSPITKSMVENACVNKWHHLRRRSALEGLAKAKRVARDFEEGSRLLNNGEQGKSFGLRRVKYGVASSWVAFMPVSMTLDGKSYVWCVFDPSPLEDMPRVVYRSAGTVDELFSPISADNNFWGFPQNEGLVPTEGELGVFIGMLSILDTVPAGTPLANIWPVMKNYQKSEDGLRALSLMGVTALGQTNN